MRRGCDSMKFLRHIKKILEKDTRRNMPVKSPVSKKSSEPVILKSVTVLIGEISKKLPSRTPEKTVQEIFQKAQKAARKSVKATEKTPAESAAANSKRTAGRCIIFHIDADFDYWRRVDDFSACPDICAYSNFMQHSGHDFRLRLNASIPAERQSQPHEISLSQQPQRRI